MHGGIGQPAAMNGHPFAAQGLPTMPGQDAFGAIQEVVQILDADPTTDWSKVNISALREHLIDMNEVTLHAAADSARRQQPGHRRHRRRPHARRDQAHGAGARA